MDLLIIGIDPGTTVGYAILDINGSIIKIGSSKSLSLNKLISLISKVGRPLIIGTDKAKVPSFVESFAVKTGARIIHPKLDLSMEEKRVLVRKIRTGNSHEFDALASAFFAFKTIYPLLKKVDIALKNKSKLNLATEVKQLVISKNMSISHAIDLLEKPKARIVEAVFEQRIPKVNVNKLNEKVINLEKENKLVKEQNNKLRKRINEILEGVESLKKKISFIPSSTKKQLGFKEKNIATLNKELKLEGLVVKDLMKNIDKLRKFLSKSDAIILKKLRNLSWEEFNNRDKILNIKEGDVLLIDDLAVYSQKTLDFLKGKNIIIVYKKKGKQDFGLALIKSSNLNIEESTYFATMSNNSFDKEKRKLNIIETLVKEYRKK